MEKKWWQNGGLLKNAGAIKKKKSQRTTERVHFQKSDESIRMRKTKTNYSVLAWYVKEMQKVEAM